MNMKSSMHRYKMMGLAVIAAILCDAPQNVLQADEVEGTPYSSTIARSNQSVSLTKDPKSVSPSVPLKAIVKPQSGSHTISRTTDSGLRQPSKKESSRWYHSLFAPAAVLALIAVVFILIRKFVPGIKTVNNNVLKIMARAAISPKHSIALISVGPSRYVLVGMVSDGITALCDITDEKDVADLATLCLPKKRADKTTFGIELQNATTEFEKSGLDAGDSPHIAPCGIDQTKGQLTSLLRRIQMISCK